MDGAPSGMKRPGRAATQPAAWVLPQKHRPLGAVRTRSLSVRASLQGACHGESGATSRNHRAQLGTRTVGGQPTRLQSPLESNRHCFCIVNTLQFRLNGSRIANRTKPTLAMKRSLFLAFAALAGAQLVATAAQFKI